MNIKSGVAVCAALVGACLLTACGGAQSRFATHMNRGQTYFSQGDFTKASVEFRNAMQIEPKDTNARLMAGRAAEKLGKIRDAMSLYQAVIDAVPDDVDAHADLARLFVFGGVPEQAQKIIQPVLAKHPDNAALLTYRAAARMQLKDTAGAVADAEHALKLAPLNEDAIELRAGLYKQAGDIAGAAALVSDAVTRLPKSTSLREVLADLYAASGEPAKAEEQLRALVGLQPQEPKYRYQLAVFYSRAHRLDDAQRVLEEAVKALPNDQDVKLTLVDFISSQRTRAQGEQVLEGFIAHEPDNYDLRLGLGALEQRFGAEKEAIAAYEAVVERDSTGPKGLVARDRLAAIAFEKARYDDASKLIDQVLAKNPHDNDSLTLRAEIALTRTDPAAAIGDLRAVLRDQPQAAGIRRLLARAYVANGEPALAEETLRAAVDAAPRDISLRIELAKVLEQTQVDRAISLLEEAVHDAPTNPTAREALASAYLLKRDFANAHKAAGDLETLRPDSAMGPYLAGLAAEGQNQPDEAQKDYEHALSIQPQVFDVLAALARLEAQRGHGAQAIALLNDAAQRDPSNAAVVNLLGEIYLAQKNASLASTTLTRATTLAPKWWVPYRNLALARLAGKDAAGAISAYESAIKDAPKEPRLIMELASLYEHQGRTDDAIEQYEAWYQQNPRAQLVANNLAMLLVTYRKDRASLDRARDLTAAFASSNDGSLLDTNGWVHFKRAEYAEALSMLERAAERAPDSKEIRCHLGLAELRAGEIDRARNDLEAALTGSANFSGADEARVALAGLKNRAG